MADAILSQFKTCITCALPKRVTEFYRNTSYKDGYAGKCKKCVLEYQIANKDRFAERVNTWVDKNRVLLNARQNEYRSKNREKIREADRKRYAENPAPARSNAQQYQRANAEKVRLYRAQWGKDNPDKVLEISRNRRARKKGAEGSHTAEDIHRIWVLQRGLCAACRKRMKEYHVDHIVPLAKGGSNYWTNLQLLHPQCNHRKKDKDPIDFMQTQGFLI